MEKKLSYGLATLAFFLLLVSSAFGATLIRPVTTNIMNATTYFVNVTTTFQEARNCSVTFSSTLSGDSVALTLLNQTGTDTARQVNVTFDTTVLEDASDYAASGTCYNSSGGTESLTAVASIVVDNTAPVAASSLSPTSSDDENNVGTWSATVTAAQTTSCVIYLIDPVRTQTATMTHSGSTCTYGSYFTVDGKSGPVTWIVEASDGYNKTNSSAATITFGPSGTTFAPGQTTTSSGGKSSKEKIVIFGVALLALYALTKDKGKKKK